MIDYARMKSIPIIAEYYTTNRRMNCQLNQDEVYTHIS